MKHKRLVAILVVLALLTVGAKLMADVTMSDGDWIGLASDAGRIVFEDSSPDEVFVYDADFGVGTASPGYDVDIYDGVGAAYVQVKSGSTDAGIRINGYTGEDSRLYWLEHNTGRWGLHYYGANDYLRLYNYNQSNTAAYFHDNGDINLAPNAGNVAIGSTDAPTYDLDVSDNLRATNLVKADVRVEIGDDAEDFGERGSMPIAIDAGDHLGGYFIYAEVVTEGSTYPTGQYEHDVAVVYGVRAEWIAVNQTTGEIYSGTGTLEYDAQGDELIMVDDEEDGFLALVIYRGAPPNHHEAFQLLKGSDDFRLILRILYL